MDPRKKETRYGRIYDQLSDLVRKSNNPLARMATVIAVLHHKMDYFFWTGFYMVIDGEMTVQTYQGPVACQVLEKNRGVCWASFNQAKTIVVNDVHQFPGHIACDSRSKSEIVVPFFDKTGILTGVLDVDSSELAAFDEIDSKWLEKILALIHT